MSLEKEGTYAMLSARLNWMRRLEQAEENLELDVGILALIHHWD